MRHTRIVVDHCGGPDVLQVVKEECLEPPDGEVRVRMLAAGVGRPDIMARQGIQPETPQLPNTPVWDLLGVVDRRCHGVEGVEAEQRVVAMPIHAVPIYALYVIGGWLLPGHRRINPYSIQTLKQLKPGRLRQDLGSLLDLLQQRKIESLVALGKGCVMGNIILVTTATSPEPEAA